MIYLYEGDYEISRSENGDGIGTKTFIDGIGIIELNFFPYPDVKYSEILADKSYFKRKTLERLEALFSFMEELDEN